MNIKISFPTYQSFPFFGSSLPCTIAFSPEQLKNAVRVNYNERSRTEIKMMNARCSWEGNTDFRTTFMRFLDLLEKNEHERKTEETPKNLSNIKIAKEFVNNASDAFKQVQLLLREVNRCYNDLRLQEQVPNVQIGLIEQLRQEIKELKLPETLTEETVKQYAGTVKVNISRLKQRFDEIKNISSNSTIRNDVHVTTKKGSEILCSASEFNPAISEANKSLEVLLQNLASAKKNVSEDTQIEKLIQKASFLKALTPKNIDDVQAINGYVDSVKKLEKKAQPFIGSNLTIDQSTPESYPHHSSLLETVSSTPSSSQEDRSLSLRTVVMDRKDFFAKSFESLKNQSKDVESLFSPLLKIIDAFWVSQENKLNEMLTEQECKEVLDQINFQSETEQQVIDILQKSISETAHAAPLRGNLHHIKKLRELLDENLESKVILNAIAFFKTADHQNNLEQIDEFSKEQLFFESKNYTAIADHYKIYINHFMEIDQKVHHLEPKNQVPTNEELETYSSEWNKQIAIFQRHRQVFLDLKATLLEVDNCWNKAYNISGGAGVNENEAGAPDKKNTAALQSILMSKPSPTNFNSANEVREHIKALKTFVTKINKAVA